MAISDKDLANLEIGIYGKMKGWDLFNVGDVVWACRVIDGISIIVLRGSICLKDFIRDLEAAANPFAHDGLGPVHPGFALGMDEAWKDIKVHTAEPRIVVGHSLGAARGAILSGLMVLDGQPPIARVAWGEPKSGFGQLSNLIRGIPTRSYRNGNKSVHDPVTDLPFAGLINRYTRATPFVNVSVSPKLHLGLDWRHLPIISWHNMELYRDGMSEEPIVW